MKNFRETSKKFRKNFRKYFMEDLVVNAYTRLEAITCWTLLVAMVTVAVLGTRQAALNAQREAQEDALKYFYSEYMDACHEVNNGECHWEFTYMNGVVYDVSVKDDEGYYFAHYLDD